MLLGVVTDFPILRELETFEASAARKSRSKKKKSSKGSTAKSKTGKGSTSRKRKGASTPSRRRTAAARRDTREQPQNDTLTLSVNSALLSKIPQQYNPGGLRVNSVKTNPKTRKATISLNENFTYLPVTQELIAELRKEAQEALPDSISDYEVSLNVGGRALAYYITKVDPLPEASRLNTPFVVESEPWVKAVNGMENDVVALWHSHGRYFKPGSGAWMWQRPLLFQTVEDIFTMSYILPYVTPMLENAGAYVLLPRERDINPHEVIVDNDINEGGKIYSQPYYREVKGKHAWTTGEGDGFIYDLPDFRDTENPFLNGTYRQVATAGKNEKQSQAQWYADIPQDGEYAVYVSYKSLPNSAPDARYTVHYDGGVREYKVNQTMGGGTWIYLGTFPFKAGYSQTTPIVSLSNISGTPGTVITADAVKIGGGMGNIARSNRRSDLWYDPSTPIEPAPDTLQNATSQEEQTAEGDDEEDEEDDTLPTDSVPGDSIPAGEEEGDDEEDEAPADSIATTPTQSAVTEVRRGPAPVFRTSGLPRYLEGARYWMQWAGFPEWVYSPYHGSDDYKDDYTSRGHWVNYLAGGSRVLPNEPGLGVPVDVALALHSDAGKRSDDSYVGTLGIYYSADGARYADGTPRINSRMLTDMVMRQITNDIRATHEPRWTRRSMWDKSYVEARVPEVPTTLIELLSHQNFADMQLGLDPDFRFTVSRAIYKALGRFMAERKQRDFVVQPLPVQQFAIKRVKKGHYRLSWAPTPDPLEPTATPTRYIILERSEGQAGFHKIGETSNTHFDVRTADTQVHSFRIVAANTGGLSFDSETLAFAEGHSQTQAPVLVVNAFTRVSGPQSIATEARVGFDSKADYGVPYKRDISFSGYQQEFRRSAGESTGRSSGDMASQVVAGNTFDYPAVHGEAIVRSGRGFVSASLAAVEQGDVRLADYPVVDLILGRQRTTQEGSQRSSIKYSAFSKALQQKLTTYTDDGGDLIVSGENVISDLYDPRREESDKDFALNILGVIPDSIIAHHPGAMRTVHQLDDMTQTQRNASGLVGDIRYNDTLTDSIYIVQQPDALLSAEEDPDAVMLRYTGTGRAAAILTRRGKNVNYVMGVPLEAITDPAQRAALMRSILDHLK